MSGVEKQYKIYHFYRDSNISVLTNIFNLSSVILWLIADLSRNLSYFVLHQLIATTSISIHFHLLVTLDFFAITPANYDSYSG